MFVNSERCFTNTSVDDIQTFEISDIVSRRKTDAFIVCRIKFVLNAAKFQGRQVNIIH